LPPLSTARLLAYALPALPLAALTLPLYIIVPTFYSETMGLTLAAVGTALLVVRLFDAVSDPLIGWAADRVRPRFGRRRTVFALSLPVAALAGVMLFWPPDGVGPAYVIVWGTVLSLGFTGATLSYQAWGAELAGSYRQRSRISGFREGFTIVGTLVAITLPFAIGMERADHVHGLAMLGIAVAAGLLFCGLAAMLIVPEPPEYSVTRVALADGLRHMARNAPFVRLIAAYLVNGLANGIPASLFLYFVSSVLDAPEARGWLLFLYFLSGIAGVPLAVFVAGRVGKHRAWCWAMLANMAFFAGVALLGPGDIMAFAVICVATGICLGFDLALPAAIQADVIDVDTAASGEQRSGLYFAAWGLATKLSLALAVGIVFPLLALFGFDPNGGAANSETALLGLTATYVALPIVLKLAAIAMMWNFPLDEATQSRLRADIESRGA
jgi:GPH family glycoside/pentoside/hexuronide:cation symporter